MKDKRNNIYKAITILFLILMVGIIISLIINVNFNYESKQPTNTIINLLIACVLIILFIFIKPIDIKLNNRTLIISSLILFVVQMYIFNSILFRTGWDSTHIVDDALALSNGYNYVISFDYYSTYPNNMFLCVLYSSLASILKIFGTSDKKSIITFIMFINSIISNITCYLIYKISNKHTNNFLSLIAYIISILLIALSPWNIIPYSDEIVIIIPVLILFIYDSKIKNIFKIIMISLLSFIGYSLKPQSIIIVIAILLISVINCKKENIRNYFVTFATGTLVLLICSLLLSNIYLTIGFNKDNNKQLGIIHYVMMGLNKDTYGSYNQIDVDSSMNCETKFDRDTYNIQLIKERILSFTGIEYLDFLSKKLNITFNDGSFSWGKEGSFYLDDYSLKLLFSDEIKQYYYNDGKLYSIYINFVQIIWFFVIISCFTFAILNKQNTTIKNVLILALIGSILFQMLFETRARYLYTNISLFIILPILMINLYQLNRD